MQWCSDELLVPGKMSAYPWYAVYTKHQHEKAACDALLRQGFEVFLPLYAAAHRWKDRTKTVLLPIFPCYLFLRADLQRKVDILKTPGVFWLVESGGRACEIPEPDIDGIRRVVQSPARAEPHPVLKSGEYVRVSRGPLAGLRGILTRIKSNLRLVLSVDLLQKAIAVEVDLSMVEPVNGDANRVPLVSEFRASREGATFA
jgi:transcription antitermination factor NusG